MPLVDTVHQICVLRRCASGRALAKNSSR